MPIVRQSHATARSQALKTHLKGRKNTWMALIDQEEFPG
jgi:hypothetical protein